jgi:hypothetical protein
MFDVWTAAALLGVFFISLIAVLLKTTDYFLVSDYIFTGAVST